LNKQFTHYNFISCIYKGKEEIFCEGYHIPNATYYTDVRRPSPSRSMTILSEQFNFSEDEVVVFVMGYKYEYDMKNVIDHIKSLCANKITVFNDDAHTPWSTTLLTKIIEPLKGKTHEGVVISHIVGQCEIEDYRVYDCEYGALKYYFNIVSPERYHYYDCFTQTFMIKEYESYRDYEPSDDIVYKVCCTNKKPDIHRLLACVHLIEEPDAKLTYYDKPRPQEVQRMISFTNTNKHINPPEPTYKLLSLDYREEFDRKFKIFSGTDLTWDANEHNNIIGSNQIKSIEISRDSFLTVVAETLWDTNTRFWSEKTLKPIYMLRPFVLLAPPRTLDLLRRLGFQTFSSFWDESYDEEENHGKRFQMVMNIVDDIRAKSFDELKTILVQMNDVLQHNKRHCDLIHKQRIL